MEKCRTMWRFPKEIPARFLREISSCQIPAFLLFNRKSPHCVATFLRGPIYEGIKSLVEKDPSVKVKVIIEHIRKRFNYTTTYKKAWIAKNKAIE
jgi:hypothetical protein